jgi:carbamoyl-phosphate synthase/aspartate carbamoyltransferase
LETFGEDNRDEQKLVYSLTQHLANNLIDMYINLPSKNQYRRPASYTSKGYHTRRMAVDFAVPLITNIKVAKMLAEALVRRLPLDVSSVDSKSSHLTHVFPGLVNVVAFVPKQPADDSNIVNLTEASVSAGFTTALVVSIEGEYKISDRRTLERAKSRLAASAHCNYAFSISASASNILSLDEEIRADIKCLFIPFHADHMVMPLSVVASHFATWPHEKPIITDAKGSDLASILLLASLHSRSVHITDIQSKDDLLLISLSKAKQLKVTCDVSVYALFFNRESFAEARSLPSAEDQKMLWKNLDLIDVFSVGPTAYRLALETCQKASSWSGILETLPLLLTAVTDGRLTLDGIRARLHDNPIRIFGLPDQAHSHVEVNIGRRVRFDQHKSCWSPLEDGFVTGAIHRVIFHGQTVFLDGLSSPVPLGRDISSATVNHGPLSMSTSSNKSDFTTVVKAADSSQGNAMLLSSVMPSHHVGASQGPHAVPLTFSHPLPHPAFHRRHILTVKQFTNRDVHELFSLANEMRLQVERNGTLDILKGRVLCTLFYEPSTRTSSSFDAAMKRCGGEVVAVGSDTSSVMKGETLPDTIRTLGCYADAIVIRHPDVGSARLAAKYSPVPIINAGDGTGEHPTQVILTYCCRGELKLQIRHSWTFTRSDPSLAQSTDAQLLFWAT